MTSTYYSLYRKLLVSYKVRKKPIQIRWAEQTDDSELEDIKTFFSEIIIKIIILMKEIIHIQKVVITHVTDIFWSHSFGRILNILLSEFLDVFFFHCVISSVFRQVYHSGGNCGRKLLCRVMLLHYLSVHFIERNSLVVLVDFQ